MCVFSKWTGRADCISTPLLPCIIVSGTYERPCLALSHPTILLVYHSMVILIMARHHSTRDDFCPNVAIITY